MVRDLILRVLADPHAPFIMFVNGLVYGALLATAGVAWMLGTWASRASWKADEIEDKEEKEEGTVRLQRVVAIDRERRSVTFEPVEGEVWGVDLASLATRLTREAYEDEEVYDDDRETPKPDSGTES